MTGATIDSEILIRGCVRRFYDAARADDLLGPVFAGSIKNWDNHLSTMDAFWETALLGVDRYRSAPFPPHLKLTMGQEHFDRWRDLWVAAAADTLPEPLLGKATSIGQSVAHCWGRAYTSMTGAATDAGTARA